MKRVIAASAVVVIAGAFASTASAVDYTFTAILNCRAPGTFVGTVEIYHAPAGEERTLVATLVCSDEDRQLRALITMDVSSFSNEAEGDGVVVDFHSTSFVNTSGCTAGTGIAGLENQGYGTEFSCSDYALDGASLHANQMDLHLFSAGDQPGYIGRGCPSPLNGCGNE